MKIGIYQSYWGGVGGGQRYIGVVADVLSREHHVELVHHCPDFDPARIVEPMDLDLSRVHFRYLPRQIRPDWPSVNPLRRFGYERQWGRDISAGYDLFIDSSDNVPYFCHARRGVLLTHFPLVNFEEFHGRTTAEWQSRSWVSRLSADFYHRLEWSRRFATYDLCLVNSHFTRRWLRRLWQLDGVVVYPPLRGGLTPRAKEPIILTVGAFSHTQHKKQDVALKVFRDLCDGGLRGWRYVLAGACGSAAEDQAHLARLRESARGYPIEVRTNLSGRDMKELLGTASILWHAMGYGVDEEREPGRLEHFGMVATEAMASGCVPLAFDGGGLPESITHGVNGFLWRTLEDLGRHTLAVVKDESLRARLAAAGLERARHFDEDRFASSLLSALGPVLDRRQSL